LGLCRVAASGGCNYEKRRVVRDGNLITAGGVTSGIDFGLEVVSDIAGEAVAKSIQLALEYDPHPPFASGHPDTATAQTLAEVAPRYEERRADFRQGIERLVMA
jgi:cyclohexyl-isocyanide hydratase